MENELCPVCIENPAINFTECNHGFCISCLCRIKKCAMCRNPLQRAKLCNEIRETSNLIDYETINRNVIYNRIIRRNGNHGYHSYIEITLPEMTHLRRNHNISNPVSVIRIPRWQTITA
jgi:hypothetical protein